MPFTFSHPAILIPFRKAGSITALVIGSIVPDFQAFMTLGVDKKFSHSWSGAFLFDLPLALLLCYLFHGVVRKPFIDSLPHYFTSRFGSWRSFDWKVHVKGNRVTVLVSLLAGIASHIWWDQLTHPGLITGMEKEVTLFGISDPLFVFVQFACSIPALLLIFCTIHRLPVKTVEGQRSNGFIYWTIVVVVVLFVLIGRFLNCHSSRGLIDIVINTTIGGALLGILMASVASSFKTYKSKLYTYIFSE
jgi:hypothetical protein